MGNTLILLTAVGLFVVAVLIIVLYLFYYRSKINHRLVDTMSIEKTKLWSPMRVCLSVVIGALTVFALICLICLASSPTMPVASAPSPYEAKILSLDEMKDGYLSKYAIKENAGYTKTEKVIDDVKYTYFISTETTDALHPSFLIYAEYIGNEKPKYYDVDISFQNFEGQEMANMMIGESETKGKTVYVVVGNAFSDTTISCIVDFHNDQRKEFSLEKLRKDNTPLVISIPMK